MTSGFGAEYMQLSSRNDSVVCEAVCREKERQCRQMCQQFYRTPDAHRRDTGRAWMDVGDPRCVVMPPKSDVRWLENSGFVFAPKSDAFDVPTRVRGAHSYWTKETGEMDACMRDLTPNDLTPKTAKSRSACRPPTLHVCG
jgi:hypothetical protein